MTGTFVQGSGAGLRVPSLFKDEDLLPWRAPLPPACPTAPFAFRPGAGDFDLADDLIRHSKFGDGVVTRIIDAHKVEILFKDEARTLAQALDA